MRDAREAQINQANIVLVQELLFAFVSKGSKQLSFECEGFASLSRKLNAFGIKISFYQNWLNDKDATIIIVAEREF